eukprot:3158329-Rhodomonas_salina.1
MTRPTPPRPTIAGPPEDQTPYSPTQCSPCGYGYANRPDGPGCIKCGETQYTDSDRANACKSCAPGSAPNPARSDCVLCPPGHYRAESDTRCKPCPAGSFQDTAGASSCLLCVQAYSNTPASTECTQCVPGGAPPPRHTHTQRQPTPPQTQHNNTRCACARCTIQANTRPPPERRSTSQPAPRHWSEAQHVRLATHAASPPTCSPSS